MAHAQKPNLVFQRKGRVHLNRRGCQFSRLLAAEECGSADSNCIDRVPTYSGRLLATHSIRIFPLHSPSRHRVPSDSERAYTNRSFKSCTRFGRHRQAINFTQMQQHQLTTSTNVLVSSVLRNMRERQHLVSRTYAAELLCKLI